MPYYSPERRAALLKMLLPPLNLSMAEVSRREGVSEMSLSNWRKQLGAEGSAVSENKPLTENWSAETKFTVVLEAAGLSEIDLGEYCRRKGLYPEQITAWRQAFIT
ncbi:transposase IS3/IS911 family protein, partial [Pseudomonas syringae pv. actinidiae ICMP 18804]